MKLARVARNDGPAVIGVLEGNVLNITQETDPLSLVGDEDPPFSGETRLWDRLLAGEDDGWHLLPPINAPEVWAYGFTYQRGPQFNRSEMIPSGEAYRAAISAGRPEIFFKTTGFRVVGPNEAVGIRGDSRYTAVEPELCLIVDENARPLLFTAGNDVSAWDIEAQNPLWLAQCKTYEASCTLGPLAVTEDEIPRDARVRCRVLRNSDVLFDDSVPLSDLLWSYDELASFAAAYTPLPRGTILMTGTAVIRPGREGLIEGDIVETIIDGIGTLRNTARRVDARVPDKFGFKLFTGAG